MTSTDKINKLFSEGNSCLKSVFLPYSEELGIKPIEALEIISIPFAGINTCGAVLGAIKVLELKYPNSEIHKEKFIKEFKNIYNASICRDIKSNLKKSNKSCTLLVGDTALILENIINK